eukprot:CAMPEP_0115763166 /NCGR_PEP_ID=MMETSP0272-20121206/101400_1 /TAXON_ID=71861 /ORGANISM="Scrippsiella trochoidea, Strain CCMP3099" /LENGTH=113 /DNA_ID=CAMNT_0003208905 /DNA_START=262 /DNA_END=600 /DNA_ORIENTATION=+
MSQVRKLDDAGLIPYYLFFAKRPNRTVGMFIRSGIGGPVLGHPVLQCLERNRFPKAINLLDLRFDLGLLFSINHQAASSEDVSHVIERQEFGLAVGEEVEHIFQLGLLSEGLL